MKRIVICADGTWNERDQMDQESRKRRPTNVTKVARTILTTSSDGTPQIVCYLDGVGTGGGMDKLTGGAFGDGICANVVALYRFILYNYSKGDQLFFFGFSRGAFTVRTLIGFMNRVGLLDKDDDYFVPDMFALYERNEVPGSDSWKKAFRKSEKRECPPIAFVGVWDTVGALGAPGWLGRYLNGNKYAFHDVGLNEHVTHAYHALAIDEHRVPFEPTWWERPADWPGVLEQVWFCGAHSNVGGGYKPDGLANIPLQWLVEKAKALGLEFDADGLSHFQPHATSVLRDSMTKLYRPMGVLQRKLGDHRGDGEMIHRSVVLRWKELPDYRPKNLPPTLLEGLDALPIV